MKRIALGIEYLGTPYCGWQFQVGDPSVQATLEKALSFVADEPIRTVCSGRTDTGVHGFNQVVHFDTNAERSEEAWVRGTNANLPSDISVRWMRNVDDDFSARFNAFARSYRYFIYNHPVRSAVFADRAAWFGRGLDEQLMDQAAKHLLGEHDFTSFRSAGCQAKSTVRTITELKVSRRGDFVIVDITANAFLYNMVRNIVGTLMKVGVGDAPTDWTKDLLAMKDRDAAGVKAPASGLYFINAHYPEEFGIPKVALSDIIPL